MQPGETFSFKEGVAIVAVEHPEKPRLDELYNADGKVNNVHRVKPTAAFRRLAPGQVGQPFYGWYRSER